ncbi:MAG TPA: Glu/Leu/Phe/Val dehydrogenase dimerization domain-containing protein [Solirubrobacteraceae bacterium]|nr:Glu/Leu/Phe/Val dehydrogenase dimerization domain-containing protein [Solirubrobacteraceae bacterium]
MLEHERVAIALGERSALLVIVAVHSTVLGQAVGGCRLWRYRDWREALEDALRLSEAMTLKCALAGLPLGGGKSVIALAPDCELTAERRRAAMLDLGDAVDAFGGSYGVGEDVGTTAEDMLIARERTRYAYCLPESQGGAGEPSEPTAEGVRAAIGVTLEQVFGTAAVASRRITIIGLGQVGSRVARRLAADGAELLVADIDLSKRRLADELGATWIDPESALRAEVDLLVPAALGGVLTAASVATLRCAAIAGPANNQLADDRVADALHGRGILWAPDFVVNAGGVIYGSAMEFEGCSRADALARVGAIAGSLGAVFSAAQQHSTTPLAAARRVAGERLRAADRRRADAA